MFIDYAKIKVKAGDGGSGCSSFRREKFVPFGGPDGGDGGKGGDIIVKADGNLTTLVDYKYKKHYKAQRGVHGKGKNKNGKNGEDIILTIPVGTVIKEDNEVIADIIENKQTFIVAKGGKGGKGNARFVSPANKAPTDWEVGEKGEEKTIELELKILADVGLVGFPNSGKSTLLSKISAATPKIADYPFTTLNPNLGAVKGKDSLSFVVADIPGLIEGAHSGKGLGEKFLKHIERAKILIFTIEAISENISEEFKVLKNEIHLFKKEILDKPRIIAITKIDLIENADIINPVFDENIPLVKISSLTGAGLDTLISTIAKHLSSTI